MAKLIWAIICRRIILDQATNLVSYVDALDGLRLPQYPASAPPIFIGTLWQRGDEDQIDMNIVVYGPSGDRLAEAEADSLKFEPKHKRGRMNVGIAGFLIGRPGRYHFGIETKVKGKWVEVHRVPIDFEVPKAEVEAVASKKPAPKKTVARR